MADIFAQNLCPTYKDAFGNVLMLTELGENDEEITKKFKEFSEKYFMLPHLWRKLYSFNRKRTLKFWSNYPEKSDTKKILQYYYVKFHGIQKSKETCMEKHLEWNPEVNLDNIRKSKNYEKTVKIVETALDFPHKNIKSYYDEYVNFGAKPLSGQLKKSYEESLKLLKKFQEAGDDDEKWLECIKKLENEEAVVANIELRLGKTSSVTNEKIWNYYIEYLRSHNCSKALLEVYLRYCRFFISDKKMLKEYRKEIERIGKLREDGVTVFWVDTIEWELDFGSIKTAYSLLNNAVNGLIKKSSIPKSKTKEEFIKVLSEFKDKMKKTEERRLPTEPSSEIEDSEDEDFGRPPAKKRRVSRIPKLPHYYQKSKTSPRLSIPSDMAKYITKNASAELLTKLHQTSKYFYSLCPIPICHRLVIQKSLKPRYCQQSLFLQGSKMSFLGSQKIWLSNSLICCSSGSPSKISDLISKLHKCDATHIVLCHQTLTLEQLEFLVSSGKVKHFESVMVNVLNENKVPLRSHEIEAKIKGYGNVLKFFGMYDWNVRQNSVSYAIHHGTF